MDVYQLREQFLSLYVFPDPCNIRRFLIIFNAHIYMYYCMLHMDTGEII